MSCELEKKLEKGVISKETKEKVIEIIRRELKFLIKNNILITPSNYEKWFKVFCYIVENNKDIPEVEIFSLYEELVNDPVNLVDGQALEIKNRKEMADTLEKIADAIDRKLVEAIKTVNYHTKNIDSHTEAIRQEIEKSDSDYKFDRILDEIDTLKQQNYKLMEKLEEYHKEIVKLNTEIKIAKEEANVDFLTGLANRRSFDRSLKDLIRDFKERGYPFSIILIDIDNFKYINDTYGHPAGDEVLREIAAILKTFLRANTIIARTGGEEFGIIVPGVELENAVKIAQRIKNVIENREIKINDHIIKITASLGVTQVRKSDDLSSIYERADSALYKAKKDGKNKVEFI